MNFKDYSQDIDFSVSPQFKQDYETIYQVLYEFVNHFHPVQPKSKHLIGSILRNPNLPVSLLLAFLPLTYYIVTLLLIEFITNDIRVFWIISSIFFVVFIWLMLTATFQMYNEFQRLKKLPNQRIKQLYDKGLSELQYSTLLSQLDKNALKFVESQFKRVIENASNVEKKLNNWITFISSFPALIIVYYLQDYKLFTNFNLPSLVIIGTFIASALRVFTDTLDYSSVDKRFLSILEQAHILADKPQEDQLQFLPKPQKSGKKLMSNLQNYMINKASGFDYHSSEK